jgi:hypothetical protein
MAEWKAAQIHAVLPENRDASLEKDVDPKSHKATTSAAFEVLATLDPHFSSWLYAAKPDVVAQASATDFFRDLELIDVDSDRDDPHVDESWADDDESLYEVADHPLSAFNHFIDVKKGTGSYDDFDGYSYNYGSASVDQFQDATEETSGWAWLASWVTGKKIDEGLAYYLGDNYVHAPGQTWYRYGSCSPALENYSFYQDRGTYMFLEAECESRFPLAQSTGQPRMGFPHSVFMPVDNLARYWYHARFCKTMDPRALGPVMHAVQDASIPHHAAGYCGNWHGSYESSLEARIGDCLKNPDTATSATQLFNQWHAADDPQPPTALSRSDWSRPPARNWRVDMLVTWVALNAYRSYDLVYQHFRHGFMFDAQDAYDLTVKALSICMLILSNAANVPYSAPLAEQSLANSIAKVGLARPFSWLQALPGYPRSLRAVLYLLNSAYPNYSGMSFPWPGV